MPRNTAILVTLLLAACGTQQERCISRNTDEYRNVSRLLAEVEGNLGRGYAWEERQVGRDYLTQCRDHYRDNDGNVRTITRSCWREHITTERYRVAIDPAAEQRKRDNLASRKAQLSAQAAAAVQACKAAYPEQG
ncbi:hypothetical protein [Paracoccus homiensis]|uniref:Uncharacterized protein n=1 Tax=Paracoccus homiensis TaxID=364199 RepID=A0A1I0FFQ1_9RHOB|nr:hypothetical protein [Paracoccus homiensis]SET56828.1 hypothetical protein SAMN04489858_106205 [Paracoccus homiensis]